jgi:hypothetical protein
MMEHMAITRVYDAVIFGPPTAVLNSWKLWNSVAGDDGAGYRWRAEYLQNRYAAGRYRPYEDAIKPLRRKFLHLTAAAASLPAVLRVARAQSYSDAICLA